MIHEKKLEDLAIKNKIWFASYIKQKLFAEAFKWFLSCWLHHIKISFVWNMKQQRNWEIWGVWLQIVIQQKFGISQN